MSGDLSLTPIELAFEKKIYYNSDRPARHQLSMHDLDLEMSMLFEHTHVPMFCDISTSNASIEVRKQKKNNVDGKIHFNSHQNVPF